MSTGFSPAPAASGRVKPRISANKLAEYLVAQSPARRREIIRDQCRPLPFKPARYDAASHAIARYFTRGGGVAGLKADLQRLAGWQPGPGGGTFAVQKNRDCQDALKAFLQWIESSGAAALSGNGLIITRGLPDAPKLTKAGVAISVRPELILRGTDPKRGPFVGAVKMHFCKGFAMDQHAAEYVGTLLREYGDLHLAHGTPCDYRRCYVLDVFSKQLFPAPKAIVKRQADIESACEEIANGWPVI